MALPHTPATLVFCLFLEHRKLLPVIWPLCLLFLLPGMLLPPPLAIPLSTFGCHLKEDVPSLGSPPSCPPRPLSGSTVAVTAVSGRMLLARGLSPNSPDLAQKNTGPRGWWDSMADALPGRTLRARLRKQKQRPPTPGRKLVSGAAPCCTCPGQQLASVSPPTPQHRGLRSLGIPVPHMDSWNWGPYRVLLVGEGKVHWLVLPLGRASQEGRCTQCTHPAMVSPMSLQGPPER